MKDESPQYKKLAKIVNKQEAKIKDLTRTRLLWYEKLEKAEDEIKELKQDAITKSRVNEEILSDYREQLTLKDLFTPENSGETYVKIAKYREAEAEIKELKEERISNALQHTIDLTKAMSKAIDLSNAEAEIKELKEFKNAVEDSGDFQHGLDSADHILKTETDKLKQQIKELEESKSALKIAFNGKLATEKAACESRIKELQSQVELNYCQPCYDKLNKH